MTTASGPWSKPLTSGRSQVGESRSKMPQGFLRSPDFEITSSLKILLFLLRARSLDNK
eukprot:CAMPEP_0181539192 /NCGR_PEP_ID=MMETSP1110-20121109/76250_1 /TAXON_ID=174948 /ORGANISM="Symbiodinium sp., Strain CCMP421" /LENGTH=57 /DNA_ID=CAMNT_0023670807 /DNA_START=145 /DNA_END=318 /DNA_ORIENTATION=+